MSATYDVLLKGGTVVNHDGVGVRDIGVIGGRIAAIGNLSAATAAEVIAAVTNSGLYPNPIVTEIRPAAQWYEAEAYHQEYFARNPYQGYCSYVVGPKVAKFRRQFAAKLKPTP